MLPISVVIPHRKDRSDWFLKFCLPSVQANEPAEILIEGGDGGACEKRNAGAARASCYYLMFVDDDSVLLPGALRDMIDVLERDLGASFAYSDTKMVLYPGVPYPNPEGVRRAQPWSVEALKKGNYVETMSLMRRDVFPGFDPSIKRFQDWDLWLTLAAAGHRGVYIPKVLFELHHFDIGISASVPFEESLARIREKHCL